MGGRGHVAVCRRPARPPWRLQTHCCLWGDDPALPATGFETVFFSVRPIVELLARATIPSSTTLFSKSRKVQAHPLGGWEQASAIYLASFSPSKMRGTAGVARCLRLKTAANPSSTRRAFPKFELYGMLETAPHSVDGKPKMQLSGFMELVV